MYQRLVLAFDGSREARTALREGALLAGRYRSKVWLLSIMPDNTAVAMAEGIQPGAAHAHMLAAEDLVREGVAKLQELGLDAVGRAARGDPAQIISNLARQVRADLVVLGHRRRSFLERWWSGPSGAYVVDNIDCSLLVARREISDAEWEAEIEAIKVGVSSDS